MPKLSRPPDPQDPEYQQIEQNVNAVLHAMGFAAIATGIWFFQELYRADWAWSAPFLSWWSVVLFGHTHVVIWRDRRFRHTQNNPQSPS